MRQKHYSSDLTDSQWEQIKRYFTTNRRRKHHLRHHVLDAILYIVKTGTQWRMLPGEFAQWQTVYYYFRRWREEGRIRCTLSITCRSARRRDGRHGEPSALIIDCQSVLLRERAESAVSTPSKRSRDGNDTLLSIRRGCFGAWSYMQPETTRRSGPCSYSLRWPLA